MSALVWFEKKNIKEPSSFDVACSAQKIIISQANEAAVTTFLDVLVCIKGGSAMIETNISKTLFIFRCWKVILINSAEWVQFFGISWHSLVWTFWWYLMKNRNETLDTIKATVLEFTTYLTSKSNKLLSSMVARLTLYIHYISLIDCFTNFT